MTGLRLISLAALGAAAVFGQAKPGRPEFEVASIKPSPAQISNTAAVGVHVDGAQLRCNYLALKDYIGVAYKVKPTQITGPDWVSTDRFDIAAKIPDGVKRDQVPEMLQALLEDRFQLKFHRETKDFPVYGLVAVKGGLKITALPPDPADAQEISAVDVTASGGPTGVTINFGRGSSFALGNNKFQIRKLTFAEAADALSRFADKTVVDMTNTPGKFSFDVEMTPEDYRAMLIRSAINAGVTLPPQALQLLEGVSGESFFMALQTIGLKVESRKAPLEVLVVDRVTKAPTEN
jgi:uncharacterized protein (TIGR03435 family)